MRDEWQTQSVEDILMQLPKDVRGIGEEVLQAISCGRQIVSWDDKLKLVINNRPVPRTNIVELVQYVLYPESKETKEPRGFDSFLEALKEIGLESQWVRNESVIHALDENENDWNTTDEEDSESDSKNGMSDEDADDENVKGKNNDSDASMESSGESNEKTDINWKNFSSDSSESDGAEKYK